MVSTSWSVRTFLFQAILSSVEASEVTEMHVWEGEEILLLFGAGKARGAR